MTGLLTSTVPELDPAAPLRFIVNAASGSQDAESKRQVIESALQAAGRQGELLFCEPGKLAVEARRAAQQARASRGVIVGVGGDGTLNTVARAAHAAGCVMGIIPQGTFNYFARTHGISTEPAEAATALFSAAPTPVQVAAVNDHLFLVNASLGLYPELLEDRERYKSRFGRNRWVALWAAFATLMRAQRRLRLSIDIGSTVRQVRALTLFVGNNRLQLQQFGLTSDSSTVARGIDAGRITAVMLRPVGTFEMLRLVVHGAMGTLGEADSVEHFEFSHMVVRPSLLRSPRGVKIAFDGEVTRLRPPLNFRVLPQPLYLLMPAPTTPPTTR